MLRPVHYLVQVKAIAVVDALSRVEFIFGSPSSNRLEALDTNRAERVVRVSPTRERFASR
jgi:hypothetical protein